LLEERVIVPPPGEYIRSYTGDVLSLCGLFWRFLRILPQLKISNAVHNIGFSVSKNRFLALVASGH